MKEIRALTSLRGFFAIWVISYHFVTLAPNNLPDWPRSLAKGYLGVDFFFILSGFILAGNYGYIFNKSPEYRDWAKFLILRAGRLFPLHLLIISICILYNYLIGKHYSLIQIFEESALVHRWPLVPALFNSINGPSWSISSEWLANIFFPTFAVLTLNHRKWLANLTAFSATLSILALAYFNSGSLDLSLANTWSPTIRCFSEFSIGMLIFRWREIPISSDNALMILSLALFISISFRISDIIAVIIMVALILAVQNNTGLAERFLGIKVFHWLGRISFSLYLIHLPVMIALR